MGVTREGLFPEPVHLGLVATRGGTCSA